MGLKESTGEKGMFPANFTRPLWAFLISISSGFIFSSNKNRHYLFIVCPKFKKKKLYI